MKVVNKMTLMLNFLIDKNKYINKMCVSVNLMKNNSRV